ncbi:hypothetical protein CHO01_38790 [Cellulomonas hominis]|uniref:Uncharacterized protein n=1 Tax=Cellulomonas hominis TaxID=156981 RepID=A0A511FHS5_9CELL|nr:hypothetical protein [Cellulomonas hominis]MBB5474648.1 hypothetical protein [Cellulomonas hominis]NKY06612.1 hypothetical protein [Cellulomonas hominis]GEL48763.1 hypothetical protein CHO01_38790 [Cellulomonas hominis]
MPDGTVRELSLESIWDDPERGESRDGVAVPYDPTRTADDLELHVETARRLGRHQRALDAAINAPQRRSKPSVMRGFDILYASAACDSQGRTIVQFEDGRCTNSDRVVLRLDERRRVEAIGVNTQFGLLLVRDDDMDRVAGAVDRDLGWALGESMDLAERGVTTLSSRLARVLPQDD